MLLDCRGIKWYLPSDMADLTIAPLPCDFGLSSQEITLSDLTTGFSAVFISKYNFFNVARLILSDPKKAISNGGPRTNRCEESAAAERPQARGSRGKFLRGAHFIKSEAPQREEKCYERQLHNRRGAHFLIRVDVLGLNICACIVWVLDEGGDAGDECAFLGLFRIYATRWNVADGVAVGNNYVVR